MSEYFEQLEKRHKEMSALKRGIYQKIESLEYLTQTHDFTEAKRILDIMQTEMARLVALLKER